MGNRDFEKMHGNGWSWVVGVRKTPTPSHRVGRGGLRGEGAASRPGQRWAPRGARVLRERGRRQGKRSFGYVLDEFYLSLMVSTTYADLYPLMC
jgi:hypothetical protein